MVKSPFKISSNIEYTLSSAHLGVLSILLILQTFGVIAMDSLFYKGLVIWVALQILVLPIARKRFITPKVVNPKCPYCGANLTATELYCESCKAVSKASKEKK
jgi:hypothetical protein